MVIPSSLFSLTLLSGFSSIGTGISGGGGNFFVIVENHVVCFGHVQGNLPLGAPCLKINYGECNVYQKGVVVVV